MNIGDKYGRFTVVGKTEDYRKVVCQCECGNTKIVRTDSLRNGSSKSCGCWKQDRLRLDNPSESAFNALYSTQYKRRAEQRGYAFDLSKDDFRALTQDTCYYCGVEPYKTFTNGVSVYTYNGIDRIDNTKGYVKGNVRTACFACNQAKHTMTTQEFDKWVQRLIKHNTRKS